MIRIHHKSHCNPIDFTNLHRFPIRSSRSSLGLAGAAPSYRAHLHQLDPVKKCRAAHRHRGEAGKDERAVVAPEVEGFLAPRALATHRSHGCEAGGHGCEAVAIFSPIVAPPKRLAPPSQAGLRTSP